MIQIRNLSKSFGNFKALDDVCLTVPKGSVYGLIGPNGAGKSTLIRCITGVYAPDRKGVFFEENGEDKGSFLQQLRRERELAGQEVLIDGQKVYENRCIKERIAYIPDDFFYFMQANTLEMMRFYKGIYPNFDEKLFYRMQEYFPAIDIKQNIRQLSKGMQKQVAFWLSLSCRPEVLILDEPVDGLDPVMRRQIWSILLAAVSEGNMTVLVSSHNLRELEDVCDHVGILNKGKVMIERSLEELQGNISKIQVACEVGMPKLPAEFEVLHMSNTGRVYTLIVKGEPQAVAASITTEGDRMGIVDILPLTLEEIFIYEMGGNDYEVKEILF